MNIVPSAPIGKDKAAPVARPVSSPAALQEKEASFLTRDQFFAFDVRGRLFASPERREELAKLYAEVFNSVSSVPEKWSLDGARNMVEARLRKPGCNIALVDAQNGEEIVGAFFANIVPSHDGWDITEPDILIKDEYRKLGLGREIGWVGRQYANTICREANGEYLQNNHSKTYLVPDFPKKQWEKYGYNIEQLYILNAADIANRRTSTSLPDVRIDAANQADLPEVAAFIAATQKGTTSSSDGKVWPLGRAEAFVKFMHEHNYSMFNVAKRGAEIVAISSGDIMPGRDGTVLVDARCFVKSADGGLCSTNLSTAAFHEMYVGANSVAREKWRQPISKIEFNKNSETFFRKVFKDLREDRVYAGMIGDHNTLVKNMCPDDKDRKITLMPVNYKATNG